MLFDLKKGTLDVAIRAQFGMFMFDWLSKNFTGICISRQNFLCEKHTIQLACKRLCKFRKLLTSFRTG